MLCSPGQSGLGQSGARAQSDLSADQAFRVTVFHEFQGTCQVRKGLQSFGKKGPLFFLEPLCSPPQGHNFQVFVYLSRNDLCI